MRRSRLVLDSPIPVVLFCKLFQAARQGGGGLLATVTNSEATVGQLMTAATTGQTVTVAIDEGQFFSSLNGGVAFDPLTSGTTIVAASIPDFIATSQAMVQVTVDAPHVVLFGLPTSVGAGLQTFCCNVNLNHASEHGGVTVRVASSEPSVVLVAPDAVTPGAAFIDVFVPNRQTNVPFVVQGVERSTGHRPCHCLSPRLCQCHRDCDCRTSRACPQRLSIADDRHVPGR